MSEKCPIVEKHYANVPAAAAAADAVVPVAVAPFAATVASVHYIPAADVTGANTNSRTYSLINAGATGAGTTAVASYAATSGNDLDGLAENVVTISGTAANRKVAAADVLVFKSTHVGSTGAADPGGTVVVTLNRD